EAAALADEHVVIPMLGMVQSLNVSVAAAVILFEAQRQRLRAGFYDAPRLPQEELEAIAERWLARRDRGAGAEPHADARRRPVGSPARPAAPTRHAGGRTPRMSTK